MLAWLLVPAAAAAVDVVLVGARLWDGTGAPVVEQAWVAVQDGRVTATGQGEPPAGPRVELGGRVVIPGLVDTHTHPWAVPGAALREETDPSLEDARRHGLRATLACGVTTVLDAASSFDAIQTMRAWEAKGLPSPRLYFLGPTMGPTDGYVDAFIEGHPGIDDLDDARRHLDRLVEVGALGAKLTIEDGYFLPVLPVHEQALREQIVAEARARGLPVFVHAQHRDAHAQALALRPHAVMHMVRQRPGDLPARYAGQGTPLVSTLQLDASPLWTVDERDLDDPLAHLVVPEAQRRTATSRRGWRRYERGMARVSLPHSPGALVSLASFGMPTLDYLRAVAARSLRTARRMHQAGVSLVMGSDAGAYDEIPFYFHGLSSLREVELLTLAGLSPEQALLAATRDAAALLGLSGQVGVVAPGAWADLVVLDADPLQDPRALRQIHRVMRGGELRTPEAWVRGSLRAPDPR